jgi:hypothetical protein
LAARIGAFGASLCYAKITPAALHRGEIDDRCREDAEALGCKLKFQLSEFHRRIAGSAARIMQASLMAASYAERARCLSPSIRQRGVRAA